MCFHLSGNLPLMLGTTDQQARPQCVGVNGIMKGLVEPRLGKAGRGARQVNQGPAHLPRAEPFHPPELQEWLPLLGATHPAVRRGQAGP